MHELKFGKNAGNMSGRHNNHARGKNSGRWNPGKLISSHGYVLVRVQKNHHRAFGGEHNATHAYAYEHDIVMESKIGRRLLPNEEVHHDDENKQNNEPSNLIVKTKSAHMKHHDAIRGHDGLGWFPSKKEAIS
jgi:hypothetical protein